MGGETDLARMLATLSVERRADEYVFLLDAGDEAAQAIIREAEGTTYVAPATAESSGPRWAWLTLTVHSALEAVGLTAAFSRALAEADIPCNVLAGYYHDHILVPAERADDAIAALRSLRA